MREKKKKRKKRKKEIVEKKSKASFATFASSELNEIKIVGGFLIVLNFFNNYDNWAAFFLFSGIIVAICLFFLFASFMDWIDFLRRND